MATTARHPRGYKGPPASTYNGLVAALPPRPLHDEQDYERAVAMIGRLAGYKLNRDQADYLDALAVFVERYETDHSETQIDAVGVSGIDVLQALMEEHNMSGADLSALLGVSRSLGPMILRGKRSLTADHARTLGVHFGVDPGVFIRE